MPSRIPYFRPYSTAPARDRAKAERDSFYSREPWRRLRAAVLAENPLCVDCEAEGRLTQATIVHHVVDRLDRPDLALDASNLMPLCSPHHTARHKRRSGPI